MAGIPASRAMVSVSLVTPSRNAPCAGPTEASAPSCAALRSCLTARSTCAACCSRRARLVSQASRVVSRDPAASGCEFGHIHMVTMRRESGSTSMPVRTRQAQGLRPSNPPGAFAPGPQQRSRTFAICPLVVFLRRADADFARAPVALLRNTTKMNGSKGHCPWRRSRRQRLLVGSRAKPLRFDCSRPRILPVESGSRLLYAGWRRRDGSDR